MKEIALKEYIDKYKDRDVFVFGSGPSLYKFCEHPAMKDTGFIEKQITLAVNESIMRIKNPTFYFTSDGNSVYFSYWNHVLRGNFPIIAGRAGAELHIKENGGLQNDREVCFYEKNYDLSLKNRDSLVFGITSPHCAVHFANLLGAKRIVIVGCDCCVANDGNMFFWQYPEEERYTTEMPEVQKGTDTDRKHTGWMEESLNYWKQLKRNNPTINIMAWGGRLETVFPKWHG